MLRDDGLGDFARAIMTTDTRPKTASTKFKAGGATITLAGAAKGVGMIPPKMATMLSYLVTDAAVAPAALRDLSRPRCRPASTQLPSTVTCPPTTPSS